jgi:purine catabolism regulator
LAEHRYATVWLGEVRKLDSRAAAAAFATNLVAVTAADRPFAEIGQILSHAMYTATRREFSIGISRTVNSPDRIARAYQEARAALSAGLRIRGMGATTTFDELGLSRLLCLIEDESELRTFSNDLLGPLFNLDADERDDLLRTLTVLLEVHMNVAEAARVTHYHYNTMRYRISKLERLLGPFTTNGQLALMLAVALEIERLPST